MSKRLPADDYVLGDGASIRMRPLVAEDADEIARGFTELSPTTRYKRFLHNLDHLKPDQLEYLSRVDGVKHLAWAAADNKSNHGIGIARSIQEHDSADTAEYAITVADAWQGRGVGSLLSRALHRDAWSRGIRFWRATMLVDNAPVQHILESCGEEVSRRVEEGGAVEVLYRLNDPTASER